MFLMHQCLHVASPIHSSKEINDNETMGMVLSHEIFFSSASLHLLFSTSTFVVAHCHHKPKLHVIDFVVTI
jgi:hypothetical protein